MVVLVLLAAATVAATIYARSTVRDQERATLETKGQEVKSVLDAAIGSIENQLLVASGAIQASPTPSETFVQIAPALVEEGEDDEQGTFDAMALVDRSGSGPVVVAALGEGLEVGQTLSGISAETIERAEQRVVGTPVFESGGERQWAVAYKGALQPGVVLYAENSIDPPSEPDDPDQPFADLRALLYVGQEPSRDQLVAGNTTQFPLDDPIAIPFEFGADTWLMEVAARESLVGTTTARLPWLIGALGAVVTLALTALVEFIQRRRDYAVMLVNERTAALQATVADLERARGELEDADRLKDEFLDIAAHELRTPLTAIAGFSEILSNGAETDPATRAKLTERIHANALVMEELTNQLLDLSRLRAGRVELDIGVARVREAVGEALDRVGEAVDHRQVTLDVPDDLAAAADEQAVHRILVNLVTNAAKFSEPESPITIRARAEGGHVRVAVTDVGIGVPADEQALIFERFYRAGDTGSATRGTGVGLTIVAKYVELHGGRVGVESEPGVGSTFWFTLPLARQETKAP